MRDRRATCGAEALALARRVAVGALAACSRHGRQQGDLVAAVALDLQLAPGLLVAHQLQRFLCAQLAFAGQPGQGAQLAGIHARVHAGRHDILQQRRVRRRRQGQLGRVVHRGEGLEAAQFQRVAALLAVGLYVRLAVEQHARCEGLAFAVVRLATGSVVGSTRFMKAEYWDWGGGTSSQHPDAVEIGSTWLAESAQRTGVNTEMKVLMLDHAFDVLGVRRVTLKTDARNRRSRNNIERIGATFEGVLRAHMPATDGGVRDSAWYSILADEWPAARARLRARLRPPRERDDA